jgi:hypothetical protein
MRFLSAILCILHRLTPFSFIGMINKEVSN